MQRCLDRRVAQSDEETSGGVRKATKETAAQTQVGGMNRSGPSGKGLEVELTGLSDCLQVGGGGEAV